MSSKQSVWDYVTSRLDIVVVLSVLISFSNYFITIRFNVLIIAAAVLLSALILTTIVDRLIQLNAAQIFLTSIIHTALFILFLSALILIIFKY